MQLRSLPLHLHPPATNTYTSGTSVSGWSKHYIRHRLDVARRWCVLYIGWQFCGRTCRWQFLHRHHLMFPCQRCVPVSDVSWKPRWCPAVECCRLRWCMRDHRPVRVRGCSGTSAVWKSCGSFCCGLWIKGVFYYYLRTQLWGIVVHKDNNIDI